MNIKRIDVESFTMCVLNILLCIFLFMGSTKCTSLLTDIYTNENNKTNIDLVQGEVTVNVLRQLVNQETIIRLTLSKNVHMLMKDMLELKDREISTAKKLEELKAEFQTEIKNLKDVIVELKKDNKHLNKSNLFCLEQLKKINNTFDEIDLDMSETREKIKDNDLDNKKIMTDFENRTATLLSDLKIEVRYLSVTLLDLNKHTLEIDKHVPILVEENMNRLSEYVNETIQNFHNDMQITEDEIKNEQKQLSTMLSKIEEKQNNISSMWRDDVSNEVKKMKMIIIETQSQQLKITNSVSALEAFRQNITLWKTSKSSTVGFTASITSQKSSWSGSTLVFPNVISNIGNGYNPSSGIFTSPTDGFFVFYVATISHGSSYLEINILLNGSRKVRIKPMNGNYESGSNLVFLQLKQGDRVWAQRSSGNGYYSEGCPLMTFSGFKI